jgi:hypothetical protein
MHRTPGGRPSRPSGMIGRWSTRKSSLLVALSETSLPSGKRLHNYGKTPLFMGKSTISMVIFNSYVKLPEGIPNFDGISMCIRFVFLVRPFSWSWYSPNIMSVCWFDIPINPVTYPQIMILMGYIHHCADWLSIPLISINPIQSQLKNIKFPKC